MAENLDLRARIAGWREKLLDLSKRNRLINCQIGRRGAMELKHPSAADVWQLVVAEGGHAVFPYKSDLLGLARDENAAALFDEGGASEGGGSLLDECLASPRLHPQHVLTDFTDKALNGRLNRLALAARTAILEQGINNLFLAFGILKWFESTDGDSDAPLLSPVVLVPARLSRQSADSEWNLSLLEEELVFRQSSIDG